MAETTASTSHAPHTGQAATGSEAIDDLETPPITVDEANPLASSDPEMPAAPAEPAEPGLPPGQPGPPELEEEELDELIIEDFTIDGICGVY